MEFAVKAIIIDKTGKMLILKQTVNENRIFYSLPGGRIQNESSEEDELKREVKEETNLNIENLQFVGEWFFVRRNGEKTICKTYLVNDYSGELNVSGKEDYEIISPMWIFPNEFVEKYCVDESLKALIKSFPSFYGTGKNMKQDILDIVNEKDEIIGSDTRDNVHNNGLLHREIVIWIFNNKGEIAMQKRAKGKIFFPGLWSGSTCGHVDFGDSYISTVIRELEEETGIKAEEGDLIFIDKIYISEIFSNETRIYKNNIFISTYAYKFKDNVDKLRIERGEAEEFKWFKIDELFNSGEEKINKNFVPTIYNSQIQNILKKVKELFIEI